MIKLTRLRQNTPFILNPDHIERIDTHVDTVVKLTTGNEYVVNETGEEIVRRTIEYRANVLAAAGRMAIAEPEPVEQVLTAQPAVTEPEPTSASDAVPVDDADDAGDGDHETADSEEVAS